MDDFFLSFLRKLVLKYQHSISHAEPVEKVRAYLRWVEVPSCQRPNFYKADWFGSVAARILASPESPFTVVVCDATRSFPHNSLEWGYVLWDSIYSHKPEGFSLAQVEEIVGRDSFGNFTYRHFFPLP